MLKNKFYIIPVFVLVVVFSNCRRSTEPSGKITADHIKYRVTYLDDMAGDIPTKMLPDVMNAYYTNRYILTEIEGFFGQFSLIQLADLRKNSVTTMLDFFGNKVFYQGKRGEIPAGIKALKNPSVNYSNDTVTVCGLLSKKATVETPDITYDIFYIEDIDIKSPNIATPYNFIDYVLSDFRVQLSFLKMHLVMYEYEQKQIDPAQFTIPDDYVEVSRESMESIINSLFTKE